MGTNRYAYAGNDPVNKADRNGHSIDSDRTDPGTNPDAPKQGEKPSSKGTQVADVTCDGCHHYGRPNVGKPNSPPASPSRLDVLTAMALIARGYIQGISPEKSLSGWTNFNSEKNDTIKSPETKETDTPLPAIGGNAGSNTPTDPTEGEYVESEPNKSGLRALSEKELGKIAKANGFKDAHDLKGEYGMGGRHDVFVDKATGKIYGGFKDGTGLEDLGMKSKW